MRRDLVLFKQEIDALGVAVDGLLLERHHLVEIDIGVPDADSHLCEGVLRLHQPLRCVQQRL